MNPEDYKLARFITICITIGFLAFAAGLSWTTYVEHAFPRPERTAKP